MDRRLTGMSLDNQVVDIPTDRYRVHVVMDHGEHIGHQTAVLLYESETTGRCYAVDEYVNTRATTTEADADAINAMLQRRNLSLMSVDRWCGDVNSAGKQATGASVNQMLEAAFADILGVKKCPFTIETAQKGSGSVAFGQRILNLALERGDLFVTENAPKTTKALWGFRGVPRDPETHIIDTLRYALLPIYRVNARYSTLFVKR